MSEGRDIWVRAHLALACLAVDPAGLGGMVIRARPGPARDALVAALDRIGLPIRRIHPTIGDDQLFGGVDIAATLSSGRVMRSRGLLADRQVIVLSMAERAESGLAARLAQHMDGDPGSCLILLDEGAEPDEQVAPALPERLAFHIDLDGVSLADLKAPALPGPKTARHIHVPDDALTALTVLAARFGIDSLRAPLLALRCARAHAAVQGRRGISAEDISAAAALVYPSRATLIPEAPQETEPDAPDPSPAEDQRADTEQSDNLPSGEMLIEAVKALLPADLLDRLKAKAKNRNATGSGAGEKRKGNRRGRPLPPRPGRLDGRARIDLVATLRAAAPWQPLRRKTQPDAPGLIIRASDLRMRRFEEKSDRLLIFTVDASGSSAISRLNEAKGAVEILLAQAYARRDHVALVAFRGTSAEVLLPPTRSLVQTKRRLAALPGGGGTPLAAGLKQAAELAAISKTKGLTPTVVVMTDGRANIALDGSADRPRANADSETLANSIRAQNIQGLMIDTSNRPQPALQGLASVLDAPYLPLPRADAQRVSEAVSDALSAV
ncbi:magnesium chelatase subunit D [Aestuariivita sp.]|uniref:magnesium chelatase subunit D n=1 Tax=Aestuariivita sp. TaxID=1872407 RepID=UPI00216C143F|nr:magnesium chelatase subunit D [Aestuariivita sp.]MCE8007660.1 magnesium chelatase subunit D [Aestuariivita sp.]